MKYSPDKQKILINSSDTKVFDYATPNSRFFIGESINSLLTMFGNDCILNGLDITEYKYLDNGNIEFKVSPGKAIVDSTQIEYPTETILEFNPTGFDFNNGSIIISISFKFVPIQIKNLSKFRVEYLGNNGKTFGQTPWYEDLDRLIIGKFDFNNNTKEIFKHTSMLLNPTELTINNKQYILRKPSTMIREILNIVNYTVN